VTPGSWWQNPRTGQRIILARYPHPFTVDARVTSNPGHYRPRHGPNQPIGRVPAFQEGHQLGLAWLLPEEIKAAWRRYRPSRRGVRADIPVPPWVVKPIGDFNDFVLDDHFWVSVIGVRGYLVALTGVDPTTQPFTHWGSAISTTFFIEKSEVRDRLRPKYAKLPVTVWDHVTKDAV